MPNYTPFYSAQGGGSFTWSLVSYDSGVDYSEQLVSIVGLSRAASFDGTIKVPEVTITIAGGGLQGSDGIGTRFEISLTENSTGNNASLGSYVAKNIETIGHIVTIKASGLSGDVIPADFNLYQVTATTPRTVAENWINAATNYNYTPSAPAYSDSYQRGQTRVAAGAATLKVNGFVQSSTRLRIRADNQDWPATSWGSWYYNTPSIDIQRDLAPEFSATRAFLGNTPLFWHQRNQVWNITLTARSTYPTISGQKCQFPLGVLEDIYFTAALASGVLSNPTLYFSAEREIQPGEQKEVKVTFQTRQQALQAARQANKAIPREDQDFKATTEIKNKYKPDVEFAVIYSNVASYNAVKLPFYDSAKAAIAPTAPAVNAPPAECLELQKVTIKSNSSAVVTFASNAGLSLNNIQILSVNLPSMWTAYGVNSYNNLRSAYQLHHQNLAPVTIDQQYFTRDLFSQACRLGSVSLFEGASGPEFADLCRESGYIYEMPLTVNTVAEISMGTSYPLPASIALNFSDVKAQSHTYTYQNPNGQEGQSDSFSIVQGHTQGWQAITSNRLGISSADWNQNPGGLGDRFTGSYITSNHLAFNSITSGQPCFKFLTESGTTFDSDGYYYNITATYNYTVRDLLGNQRGLFLENGSVGTSGAVPAMQENPSPYLDIYPILQWLKANERVFVDNPTRQAFSVKTTLAFASAEPGDVVAVQLDKIFNGAKALATVVSVEVSTEGFCTLEIVPMHKITVSDRSNFTNLNQVML